MLGTTYRPLALLCLAALSLTAAACHSTAPWLATPADPKFTAEAWSEVWYQDSAERPPEAAHAAAPLISADAGERPTPAEPARELPPNRWAEVEAGLRRDLQLSQEDYRHFWSPGNLALAGTGIALAAPLANTPADRSVRNWYQRQVNGKQWDQLAEAVNIGGQVWIVAPVCLEALALWGYAGEDYAFDNGWYEWSNRSLRAIAVGHPPVIALYFLLGSGRPDRGDSRWHPFRDIRGASGHAFTGALPFLTAASMTDNWFLKTTLYAGSLATGWSRLHKDRHYLSQIGLGWWMAWCAVESVAATQQEWRCFSVVPTVEDGPGLAFLFRF